MTKKQLFKKVACFGDLHLGYKHNSRIHNDDCEAFIKWFVATAKEKGCETCIMLGDFHHNRASVNVSTLNYSTSNIQYLSENFESVYFITGNHDLFYREKREINSFPHAGQFDNIEIIDKLFIQDDVAIVPWLVEDEWQNIQNIKSKYMFGHFEIPGFKMNASISMPDHGQINKQHFKHQDLVFSGHFHHRQREGHIHYIGNPFGHNYADAWDFNRGAMFLEWSKEPEYVNWESGPRYITCYLSELLENTEEYLTEKTSIRATLDIVLTYEQSNFLKDMFYETYGIRDLKFINDKNEAEEMEFEGDIVFQTIDQIVQEQLLNLDAGTFNNNKLLEIYNNL